MIGADTLMQAAERVLVGNVNTHTTRNGRLFLIPASTETRGHLTTGAAKFYQQPLQELLQTAPPRTM